MGGGNRHDHQPRAAQSGLPNPEPPQQSAPLASPFAKGNFFASHTLNRAQDSLIDPIPAEPQVEPGVYPSQLSIHAGWISCRPRALATIHQAAAE